MVGSWLLARALSSSGTPGGSASWHFDYPTASAKVTGLFAFTLDNLRGSFGQVTAALAFALLLLGPLVFVCDRRTELAPAGTQVIAARLAQNGEHWAFAWSERRAGASRVGAER